MDDGIEASAPYDCSQPEYAFVLSCVDDGPQWWQIGRQLTWSLFVWAVIIFGSPPAAWIWEAYFFPRPGVPPRWAQSYVGTEFRYAKNLNLENALCVAQFFASSALVWIWVQQSYAQKVIGDTAYVVQFISILLCIIHSFYERLRNGFSVRHACTLPIFLDCLTLPPILTQGSGAWAGGSWLTLAYLRTYHCWKPMKRLLETDFFDHVISDFVQECVLAILECILVVFSIAGTLWLFEGMGDIEGFSDQFTDSGMGEISFFQMVYFSFVTISTVGFGDYSPTTVLSRAFIVFATFGGVIFFSYMTVHVFHIFDVESSGRGKFIPMKKTPSGRGHVLIMGGGVTCGSVTVLETFLRALCRSDSQNDIAEIVLMGQSRCNDKVRKMLRSEWAQGFKLSYFIGSPLDPADLARVRAKDASISFIIADFHSPDTKMEDAGNGLFASALQRCVPDAQYRLMLVSMPSISLCSSIGLQESNFFSIEALKASMMATSIRCPGFSTLILNLGLPDLPPFDAAIPGEPVSPWLKEYVQGCRLEPYGFLPGEYLIGLTFTRAAIRASILGGVLLLGAQISNGSVQLNPRNVVITANTVLFALAKDSSACDVVAKNQDAGVRSWINQFHKNRRSGNFWKKQHGKAVRKYTQQELDSVYNLEKSEGSFRRTFDGFPVTKKKTTLKHHKSTSQLVQGDASAHSLSSVQDEGSNGEQVALKDQLGGVPTPVLNAFSLKPEEDAGSINQGTNTKRRQQSQRSANAQYSGDNADLHRGGSWKKLAKMATATGNLGDLTTLARQGGHTVLILQEDHDELDQQTLWEQLEVIVKCLAHAHDERPIVVVHSYLATPSRQRFMAMKGRYGFANVSFCVGDPLNPLVLQAAGVDTCARLLTIAPSAPPTEISPDGATLLVRSDQKMDESNLMLVMLLEQHMNVWGRTDIKAIFDWYAPSSLNLLPFPPPPPKLPEKWPGTSEKSTLTEEELRILRPFAKQLSPARRGSFPKPTDFAPKSRRRVTPVLKSIGGVKKSDPPAPKKSLAPTKHLNGDPGHHFTTENPLSEGDQAYAQRDPRGHYRFAAGRIVPKPFIAALYSMAYYTPGVLEIMESLINPHQYDQDSMPWIFKVPERLVGEEYVEVATELLESATLPLGLLRDGGEEAGTPLPYVVTLTPSSDLLLRASDCVYVLAEHDWAVKHGLDGGPTSQMSQGWTKVADMARSMDVGSSDKGTSRAMRCFSTGSSSTEEHDDKGPRSQKGSLDTEVTQNGVNNEPMAPIQSFDQRNNDDMDEEDFDFGDEEDYDYDNDNGDDIDYDDDDDEEDVIEANRKPKSRRRPKNLAFRGKWGGTRKTQQPTEKARDYSAAQHKTGKAVQASRGIGND